MLIATLRTFIESSGWAWLWLAVIGAIINACLEHRKRWDEAKHQIGTVKSKAIRKLVFDWSLVAATLLGAITSQLSSNTSDIRIGGIEQANKQATNDLAQLEAKTIPKRIEGDRRQRLAAVLAQLPKQKLRFSYAYGNLACGDLAMDLAKTFYAANFPIEKEITQTIESGAVSEITVFHHPTNSVDLIVTALVGDGMSARAKANDTLSDTVIFVAPIR